MLGEISGTISHEINNPLTIINVQTFVLKDKLAKGALIESEPTFHEIENSIERISNIINNFKYYLNTDSLDVKKVEINLYETLNQLCDFVRDLNPEIEIQVIIPKDINIVTDAFIFEIIIMNLLTNAIYETKDLPKDKRYIILNVIAKNEKIDINVVDNVAGIATELEKDVFLPLKTTKPKGVGSGMGLSIARNCAQMIQGQISYKRATHQTYFTLSFKI